jgi:hypothetical protein
MFSIKVNATIHQCKKVTVFAEEGRLSKFYIANPLLHCDANQNERMGKRTSRSPQRCGSNNHGVGTTGMAPVLLQHSRDGRLLELHSKPLPAVL